MVNVFKSEESLRKIRAARGVASLSQAERMYVVTPASLTLPERDWGNPDLPGTNKATVLGPLHQVPPEEDWRATVKEKKAIYGQKNRVEVGGATEGGSCRRLDADIEPVFWKSMPRSFFEALLHGYFIKHVLDTCIGNGAFAEAGRMKKVGFFGFALSEKHRDQVMDRLVMFMLEQMCKEGNAHYNAKCAEAFAESESTSKP